MHIDSQENPFVSKKVTYRKEREEIDSTVQSLRQLLPDPSVSFRILRNSPDAKKYQVSHRAFTSSPILPPDPCASDSSGLTLHTVTPLSTLVSRLPRLTVSQTTGSPTITTDPPYHGLSHHTLGSHVPPVRWVSSSFP